MPNRLVKRASVTYIPGTASSPGRDAYCTTSPNTPLSSVSGAGGTVASFYGGSPTTGQAQVGDRGFVYGPGSTGTVINADGSANIGGEPVKLPAVFLGPGG